jgi:hypothetical protein
MLRRHHYDLAFEAFLRERRTPYIAVDETRRALIHDHSLKSFDFVVYSTRGVNLLVDIKGRRFPSGEKGRGSRWENWTTEDDTNSLLEWEKVFGTGFRACIVFAYELIRPEIVSGFPDAFIFRDGTYAFFGVWADDYRRFARRRSVRWGTVNVLRRDFQELRFPIVTCL